MKRYPLIDVAKLCCALLIVFMHALYHFENHYWGHMVVASLCHQAVPFFLIVSGFFFARNFEKAESKRGYVLNYVKKMLIYYVLWILILSPETIHLYMEKYPDSPWFYRAAVIARRVIFSGNGVYWYLLVLAESAVLVSILLFRGREKLLYILGGIGLVLGLVYDANITALGLGRIRTAFYTIFAWSNNFLMKGIPYMATGCYLARNHSKWSLRTKPLVMGYVSIALVNAVGFCVLYRWIGKPEQYLWLYPAQAVLLVLICISAKADVVPKRLAQEARPLSSAIYCVHCFFLNYAVNPLVTTDANTLLRFALGAAMSTGFYWLVKRFGCKSLYRLLTLS